MGVRFGSERQPGVGRRRCGAVGAILVAVLQASGSRADLGELLCDGHQAILLHLHDHPQYVCRTHTPFMNCYGKTYVYMLYVPSLGVEINSIRITCPYVAYT
jgi:hypothetical protein